MVVGSTKANELVQELGVVDDKSPKLCESSGLTLHPLLETPHRMAMAAAAPYFVVNDCLPARHKPPVTVVRACKQLLEKPGSDNLPMLWKGIVELRIGRQREHTDPPGLKGKWMELEGPLQIHGYVAPAEPPPPPAAAATATAAGGGTKAAGAAQQGAAAAAAGGGGLGTAGAAQPGAAAGGRPQRSTTAARKEPTTSGEEALQGHAACRKRGRGSGSGSGGGKKPKAQKPTGQQDVAQVEPLQQQLASYMTENQGLQDQVAAAAEQVQAEQAAHAAKVQELQAASAKQQQEIEMLRQQLWKRQAADKQLRRLQRRLASIRSFRRGNSIQLAYTEQQLEDAWKRIESLEGAAAAATAAATRQLEKELLEDQQRLLRGLCRDLPDACRAVQRYKADSNWNKAADGSVPVTERDKREYTEHLSLIILLLKQVDLMDSKGQLMEDGEELARLGKDKPQTGPEALKCLEDWATLFRRARVDDLAEAINLTETAANDASTGASA